MSLSYNAFPFSNGSGRDLPDQRAIDYDCQSKIGDINVVDPTGYRLSSLNSEQRAREEAQFRQPYFGDEQAHSCGGELRKTDRDYWNCDIYLRNFFINHAPINNLTYPQSSSPCITPDRTRVFQNPVQDARSEKYWSQNTSPSSTCPPRGLPIFQNSCKDALPQNMCSSTGQGIPTKQCGGSGPGDSVSCPPGDDWSRILCTKDRSDLKPWISGINRNIDAESGLRGLNYRKNADCYPNNVCWDNTMCGSEGAKIDEEERNRNSRQMFRTYFQDSECIYPNFTPKVFNNFTRAKFVMGVEPPSESPVPQNPCPDM